MANKAYTIAFISPRRQLWSRNSKLADAFKDRADFIRPWYTPALSLLTLAACTPDEFKVLYIDEDFQEIDFSIKYDIVAISAMTQQIYRAYEIAAEFREMGCCTVIGGIHASLLTAEVLKFADTVFIGEAEETWPRFLADYANGKVKQVYKNNPGKLPNLSELPVPHYDLLLDKYRKKDPSFTNMIPIQVTRGCPHDCSFCSVSKIYGKRIRKKKISQIISEVMEIKRLFKNPLVLFVDDNFFADKKFTMALLQELLPLKISWTCQSDISVAESAELLELAYRSGCVTILIGFESLNKDNLLTLNNHAWKFKQFEKYSIGVNTIQSHGIIVYAAFIIGFDHDDITVFQNIRDFIVRHNCFGQFTILTPLPGTALYAKFKESGRLIKDVFWDKCSFYDITFKPGMMNSEQLKNGIIWLHDQIYSQQEFSRRFDHMRKIYKSLPGRWEY